jgi:gamma-glutamyl phosphate reductase
MATTATSLSESCAAAKRASQLLANAETKLKNEALRRSAELLEQRSDQILEANAADLADERAARLTSALRDRLTLSGERIGAMAARSWSRGAWPAASTCARCACRWGSWRLSTRPGRT